MKVRNHHFRRFLCSEEEVAARLRTLATKDDSLWPHEYWPRMVFRGGLVVGAAGGHGPIRYTVQELDPGRRVVFRFTGPRGFDGTHGFTIKGSSEGSELHHTLEMRAAGPALLTWPLIFRPLHDALLEDSLDKVAAALAGGAWRRRRWSVWVRVLRKLLARR